MEEHTYRALLELHSATAEEMADLLFLPATKAAELLGNIERKGLATHAYGKPRRYIATSPELAIEMLASQRRADIERARLIIPELKKKSAKNQASEKEQEQEHLVEIISSRTVLQQTLMHLYRSAQKEILVFQRPPFALSNISVLDKIQIGVRVRTISNSGMISTPEGLERLRNSIDEGEEAKIFPALPIKMAVVDHRFGLILDTHELDGPFLLVRQSPLLDVLCALFELIWERATPVAFAPSGRIKVRKNTAKLSDAASQMIPQLAAGMHDKAIAYEAKVSATTLNRRIAELMKYFDAKTRFQLGLRVALDAFPTLASDVRSKHTLRRR